jgi:hypothetical protein
MHRAGFLAYIVLAALVVDENEEAAVLLAKAEQQAADARYADARRTYARIVERYPDAPAAETARSRSKPSAFVGWAEVVRHGPSENRVDVVFMGEGYTLEHQPAFDKLADDVPALFERQTTFREYYAYFNFLRANLVSADSGVDGFGRDYDTALGARTLETYSGHVGIDQGLVRRVLDELPAHDGQAIVFVRAGVLGTGSAGIAAIGGRCEDTIIHEFGHSFGGLADEYAQETHKRARTRDGTNVSATEDPAQVPWRHWIEAKVPGIGVYEGADGRVRGAWKPTASGCVMESGEFFCDVCREALILRVYSLVDPIDWHRPLTHEINTPISYIMRDEPLVFEVRVMEPASHDLEVRWWIVPEERTPHGTTAEDDERYQAETFGDRRDRGPLPTITKKPRRTITHPATKHQGLTIRPNDLEPGRYRIICRVRDTTRPRGEKRPWVLSDPRGLLESERGWWLIVREGR